MVRGFCFCGARQTGNKECSDGSRCPRQEKGHGHWHVALPFLQNMPSSERGRRYPGLRLDDLAMHVEEQGQKKRDRKRGRHPHAGGTASSSGTRRVWRSPSRDRQSERYPQTGGSSSSAVQPGGSERYPQAKGPPVQSEAEKKALQLREKCEARKLRFEPQPGAKQRPRKVWRKVPRELPILEIKDERDDARSNADSVPNWDDDAASDCSQAASSTSRASMPLTVISSDDSQASIFDLRGRIHSTEGEWSEGEESLVSSDNEDEQAAAERETVANWRLFQDLQDDKDFAFVYVNFSEAYADAGRAVAMAWARCRQRSELTLETDADHVSMITANVESMKAIDDIKKKKKVAAKYGSKPLRHPGQGTQKAELDSDKQRFFQPLVDIMKEGEAFRSENYNASDKEYTEALERRARRLCSDANVPTLHRAVTTADDLRRWMEERSDGTNFMNVQAVVLEVFIWQSNAKTRVVAALGTWGGYASILASIGP